MKYLLIENEEEGHYINKEQNKRYNVLECNEAIGPRAEEFAEFANMEEAKNYYGLSEVNNEQNL